MSDYLRLMKPRVMSLVVFTGLVGMILAPVTPNPMLVAAAVACIALGAGAAGVLNMWYDRDIDELMSRTASRPIPMGRVAPSHALWFGIVLAVASVAILGLATNWVAAALLALTIVYYIFVYTVWLKRRTALGIVVGGASGALPPVVGWAAATGEIGLPGLTLFAIIFLWTPPHTWALAMFRAEDFARAQLPLLPLLKGNEAAKRQIFAYALILFPVALLPTFSGIAGFAYLAVAAAAGLGFVVSAWRLLRAPDSDTDQYARNLFKYSIFYLFVLFASLLVDRAVGALV